MSELAIAIGCVAGGIIGFFLPELLFWLQRTCDEARQ